VQNNACKIKLIRILFAPSENVDMDFVKFDHLLDELGLQLKPLLKKREGALSIVFERRGKEDYVRITLATEQKKQLAVMLSELN